MRQPEDRGMHDGHAKHPRPGAGAVPSQAPHTAVLVIDDEPGMQHVLLRLLQRDGHHVSTAANGTEGIAALEQHPYEVILCDMLMPDLDGPGFYRELQQRYPHLVARLIFFTGDVMTPDVQTFLSQAGCPYLIKPFKAHDVRRLVQQVLEA